MTRKRGTRIRTAVASVALVASATGCYKATFYRDPSVVRGEQHERWTDFFLFGLVGTESFDVHQFCPSGQVAQVQTGGNFGTSLVGLVTIGIYTPHKVYVTCAAGSSPGPVGQAEKMLEIDANSAGEPVRARWHDGAQVLTARVNRAGDHVWRVSTDIEVQP